MSALEQEIIEKFHQLDKEAQNRVRTLIERETEVGVGQEDARSFDYDAWWADVEALREQIRASHNGIFPSIDAIGMLREIRDGEDE